MAKVSEILPSFLRTHYLKSERYLINLNTHRKLNNFYYLKHLNLGNSILS